MEKLRKERTVTRSLFTKAKSDFEINLESHIDEITAAFGRLQLRAEALFNVDERIKEQWLSADEMNEDEFLQDCLTSDKYQYDWERMKVQYDNVSRKYGRIKRPSESDRSDVSNNTIKHGCNKSTCSSACQSRRFRLPKFELRKFDGNAKNWIGFWSQFKKIDSDETMDDEDKFQYLFQCTVPDSPARELIDSFPPSGANYKKAIEQLKSRFARDDLLIEIYVRELLNLVLAQAKGNTSYNLGHLYDKLNTQLQALQSLGVTVDKYAALLFPLVESALPESVLRAWERSQIRTEKNDDHLDRLMQFLKHEVESEERIQRARSGLTSGDSLISVPSPPTAACLVSTEDSGKKTCCIWCEKSSHSSLECYKANKMSYEARKEALNKRGGCFICLKAGHNSKKCKNFTKCLFCSKRHSILMCPDIKQQSQTENKENSVKVGTSKLNNNVAQNKACTTLLQTFMVNVINDKKCVKVRACIDTGAQRSYLRSNIADDLGLKPVSRELLSHCLFGGIETTKQSFNAYEFCVASADRQFEYQMTALGKSTICGYIPRLNVNHTIIKELQKHNITLSDVGEEATPQVGLLIGADYAGLLLTESFIRLENNVVAVNTKLGWTLQGTITNTCSVMMNVVSANLQLSEVWDLETLGIRDPIEIASKAKTDSIIMDQFRDTIKINSGGRYEVDLPWKPNHEELLDNKHLAEKRLISTIQKPLKLNELNNYGQVFEDWLNTGIIEEVDNGMKKALLANKTTTISTFLSQLTYFSKYTMIVRMVGWIVRFAYNCKHVDNKRKGEVSCEEFQTAERKILKMVQDAMITDADKRKIKDRNIFKDEEGLLRVRTRLTLSDEPADFVCPIYLPGKHLIIIRLVVTKHRLLNHAGSGMLMTALRENFWITGVRRLVKSTILKCVPCKRQSVKHAETPKAPLPLDRVKPAAVFEVTGIDLAGPFFLRSGGKVWIILFTCAVYRAVHLELTKGQRTVSYEELQTLLCDCEALMNARPLTYIADDTEKLKPLSPACFLQGIPSSETPDLDQLDSDSLNRRLRYLHKLREDLRERFKKEYLGMLIQKGKEKDSNLRVGDVVLLETDAKRIKWPLAVIKEIYMGKDGNARVAKIRTADGEYTRAYQRLYPLEVQPGEVLEQ